MSPHLYIALSGHGLGHITRTLAVIQELITLQPKMQLTIATNTPQMVLQSYLDHLFNYRPVALDVGVVQKDIAILFEFRTAVAGGHPPPLVLRNFRS
ncbi:hypothetical protein GlitD10_1261 [Gloeomargarita lithophora Alchichica-D10]|uniref:Glycosyl transferase family 28 C-terminal domain-containing protein n=1 Tax=Gloeomargarita lithophora Alchichica-D10 TaxID=1188229 RepID=A0A1J0ACD5_9CYAN|nr:hypothetical protein [Gloeomargarita lithophora]APB33581.1 hypothetical protein GlitD10_1261 [Gloeomargarita lithophora Alchichica-D10]